MSTNAVMNKKEIAEWRSKSADRWIREKQEKNARKFVEERRKYHSEQKQDKHVSATEAAER